MVRKSVEDEELPADWAIEQVLAGLSDADWSGGVCWTTRQIKSDYPVAYAFTVIAFARYIEQHEKQPVDPDLLIAREAAARWCEGNGWRGDAKAYQAGGRDSSAPIQAAMIALKLFQNPEPMS